MSHRIGKKQQLASRLLMVRPSNFGFNEETSASNRFQTNGGEFAERIRQLALEEFDEMVALLRANHIVVEVYADKPDPITPDSVFPNNWVSFHESGKVVLYPMMAPNRRLERRTDIVDDLSENYRIKNIADLSYFETEGLFLEGTGSMVLDRINSKAYACLSPRTSLDVLQKFGQELGYELQSFLAVDESGVPIYHTNVIMSLGETVAVVCLEAIADLQERAALVQSLKKSKRVIVEISFQQVKSFAGNMLFVRNNKGESLVILSVAALASLTNEQLVTLEDYVKLVPVKLPTIETYGGGSARCMMAELFLPML